jgi:hypothetical protein
VEDKASKCRVVNCIVVVLTSHFSVSCSVLAILVSKDIRLVDTDASDRVKTLAAVHVTLSVTDFAVQDVCIDRRDKAVVLTRRQDTDAAFLRSRSFI